jgi:hypothetical protein
MYEALVYENSGLSIPDLLLFYLFSPFLFKFLKFTVSWWSLFNIMKKKSLPPRKFEC